MKGGFETNAFERGTYPILRFFTVEHARAMAEFRVDEALQKRIEDVGGKVQLRGIVA